MAGRVFCEKMPATMRDILTALEEHSARSYAVIEKVHAMPAQGVSSTFKFGTSYGALLMALTAAYIPFEMVTPQKWQRELGVLSRKGMTKTQHKNQLKAKAQELFPDLKVTLATADALLLAEYCRRLRR
jgi:Holliday junction resolvasome RuvABC endonuclease subunit